MKVYAPATARNRLNHGNIAWGHFKLFLTVFNPRASQAYLENT